MTDQEQKAKEKEIARIQAYQRLFSTKDGKFVMADLVSMYDTHPPIVPGDGNGTHYAVGQQSVVKHIKNLMALETK